MQITSIISNPNAQGTDARICPVCGYDLGEPIQPYDICSSCGTEFDVSDVNATIPELREAWLRTGPTWWSSVTLQPLDWNPHQQLRRALQLHQMKSGSPHAQLRRFVLRGQKVSVDKKAQVIRYQIGSASTPPWVLHSTSEGEDRQMVVG
jgi:hypothetical protein